MELDKRLELLLTVYETVVLPLYESSVERDIGFEPMRSVWKTDMLAANISPALKMVAVGESNPAPKFMRLSFYPESPAIENGRRGVNRTLSYSVSENRPTVRRLDNKMVDRGIIEIPPLRCKRSVIPVD